MAGDLGKYKLSTRLGAVGKTKTLKQMHKALLAADHPYLGLARLSVRPQKKLCDLTGLPAPYTCPRTSLRFFNLSVFKYIRAMSSDRNEKYYEIKTYGADLLNYKK